MRPRLIVWFERVILGTVALNILACWINWPAFLTVVSPALAIVTQALMISLVIVLTFLISRRRSKIAMWASIFIYLISVLSFIAALSRGVPYKLGAIGVLQRIIPVAQILGQTLAYSLLFSPTARNWMNRREVDPGVFD